MHVACEPRAAELVIGIGPDLGFDIARLRPGGRRVSALRHAGRRLSTGHDPRIAARSSGRMLDVGTLPPGEASRSTSVAWLGPRVDASTAYVCFARCVSRRAPHVVADLSSTTFMDQAGYEALMSARATIERRGNTFRLRGAAGQPSQLLRRLPTS